MKVESMDIFSFFLAFRMAGDTTIYGHSGMFEVQPECGDQYISPKQSEFKVPSMNQDVEHSDFDVTSFGLFISDIEVCPPIKFMLFSSSSRSQLLDASIAEMVTDTVMRVY